MRFRLGSSTNGIGWGRTEARDGSLGLYTLTVDHDVTGQPATHAARHPGYERVSTEAIAQQEQASGLKLHAQLSERFLKIERGPNFKTLTVLGSDLDRAFVTCRQRENCAWSDDACVDIH